MQLQSRLPFIYYSLLCLLAFTISLPFIFSSVCVFVLAFSWLLQFNAGEIKQRLRSRKAIWIWLAFYLLLAASYFYSENKQQSSFDIQLKLPMLVLPLIIGLGPRLKERRLEYILASFVSGIFFVALFFIGRGLLHYLQTGETVKLFYHELIRGFTANAVYYAAYTIFAAAILLLYDFRFSFLARLWIKYLFLAITLAFFVLLSSKSLLVLFVIFVLPVFFTGRNKKSRISKTQGVAIAAVTILGIVGILLTNNPIKDRYREILTNNAALKGEIPSKGQELVFNNVSLRVFLWEMAWDNIRLHNLWFTGCGNGDVAMLQKERIAAFDAETNTLFKQPDLSAFNLHNMYLQVLMALGIPGLLLFLIMILRPLAWLRSIPHKEIFLVFIVSFALFMLQESALETQAGVIYFSFFSQVLLLFYYSQKERRYLKA
jgi:O-antigen ligase